MALAEGAEKAMEVVRARTRNRAGRARTRDRAGRIEVVRLENSIVVICRSV